MFPEPFLNPGLLRAVLTFPWPVVLASASPRRKDLLATLVAEFTVVPSQVDEEALTDPDPWQVARRLAREKALDVFSRAPDSLVIGGDTVVAVPQKAGWEQLAKPTDTADAERMLGKLQGATHTVITGVCLKWPAGFSLFTDESEVTFKPMSSDEIRDYIATGEPMDKAGAYGLQGGARPFVESVKGSVDNVIGLPTEKLAEALREVLKSG